MKPTLSKYRGRALAWGRVSHPDGASAPGTASFWRRFYTEHWVESISWLLTERSMRVTFYVVMKYFQLKVDGVVILLSFLGS